MPKYIRTPQNTLIFSLKSQKVAGNKKRFERKNRLWGGMGLGGVIVPNISLKFNGLKIN